MPIREFRTFEEAERSLWRVPGDPQIWAALVRRWRLHVAVTPERPPRRRGVFHYRSLEEKQAATTPAA